MLTKNYLKSILLLLCVVVGGVNPAWAEEGTGTGTTAMIKFGSATGSVKIGGASVQDYDSEGNQWTIITTGTSVYFASDNSYSQIGSSSKPATTITFAAELGKKVKITAFEAKFGGFSGTKGNITMKVGENEVGSGQLNATDDVTVTAEPNGIIGKDLTIEITGIAKGVKAYYISYTYEIVKEDLTADEFGWNVDSYTAAIGASNDFPVLTNVNDVVVSYESENTGVATIDAEGNITLVAEGTTKISAVFAGDNSYNAKTVSYNLTVQPEGTVLSPTFSVSDGSSLEIGSKVTISVEEGCTLKYQLDEGTVEFVSANTADVELSVAGTVTLRAWALKGEKESELASVTLMVTKLPVTLSFSPALISIDLDSDNKTANAPELSGEDKFGAVALGTVTYTSSDESIATVDASTGVVTGVKGGEAMITATVEETDKNLGNSATFTVTVLNPRHTVTFSVNEDVSRTVRVREGEKITFPTAVEAPSSGDASEFANEINGLTFVGWYVSTYASVSDAPDFVETESVEMGTSDVTYYAVYGRRTEGSLNETDDVLTRETTGATGNSYTSWSGKILPSGAEYAGNSAGDYSAIQLRSKESNSGIITTASGGCVKKVVVVWNSNTTSGRTVDVYGKNSAYTSASDLYSTGTQGTKLGSISINDETTELNVEGDYAYIGIRSNNGALYLDKVTITWVTGTPDTYSNYCTTVSALPIPVITLSAESIEMTWGDTDKTLTATAKLGGEDFSPITLTSSSTNLTIDESGNIRCDVPGDYTITASIPAKEGEYQAANDVVCTVKVNKKDVVLSFPEAAYNVDINDSFTAPMLTNESNVAVEYSSSNTSVATVDTEGNVTLEAEGETTIKAAFAGDDLYNEVEASYKLTVSDRNRPGSATNPYTVADAMAAIDANGGTVISGVYVTGIVSQVDYYNSDKSITYWISEDGTSDKQFEVYKGRNFDGADFSSKDDLLVGDVVVIYGDIKDYYGTYEFDKDSKLVSLSRKADPELSFDETAFELLPGAEFNAPTLNNPHDLSVTYSSDNDEVATVDATTGAITIGNEEGTAKITATFVGNADYREGSAYYTITVGLYDPQLAINNTELSLNGGVEKAMTDLFTIKSDGTVTYNSADESVVTVVAGVLKTLAIGTTTITISVAKTDMYKAAQGEIELTVTALPDVAPFNPEAAGSFVKVTATEDIVNGDYLIVYESGSVAFNGSLETLDAAGNTIDVDILNGTIAETNETKASAFTIDVANGTLKSASGYYIGRTESKNGFESSESGDVLKNTFSIEDDGSAVITASGGCKLQYLKSGTSSRFRYYASKQQSIQLYRLQVSGITVGAAGWRTLVASANVKFPAEVTAYIVTNEDGETAKLKAVKAVEANVPVLLKANEGNYALTVVDDEDCDNTTGNLLKVSEAQTYENVYVLANKSNGVGFYKWTGGWMGAGRVYLPVEPGVGARGFIAFDEEGVTTGISTMQNAHEGTTNDNAVYNLNGQRVSQPAKGLYIVNGKKVFMK